MPADAKATDAFMATSSLVYHFADRGAAPADSTANGNNAETAAGTAEGALIGNGLRLSGTAPVSIPNTATLAWTAGQALTLSAWIKPAALQANAVIAQPRRWQRLIPPAARPGRPGRRNPGGAAPQPARRAARRRHLEPSRPDRRRRQNSQLFVNGEPYATARRRHSPLSTTPLLIGGVGRAAADITGFTGELDELPISKTARSAGGSSSPPSTRAAATPPSAPSPSAKSKAARRPEQRPRHGARDALRRHRQEHDVRRLDRHRRLRHHDRRRLDRRHQEVLLSQLHREGQQGVPPAMEDRSPPTSPPSITRTTRASAASAEMSMRTTQELIEEVAALSHLSHRLRGNPPPPRQGQATASKGLSGRSIQAIRASLDAGLVRENHRLTDGLVYLTISIAGGPYVGLLGTVVGVMITFAIIAKTRRGRTSTPSRPASPPPCSPPWSAWSSRSPRCSSTAT